MNYHDRELLRIIGAIKKSKTFFIAGHTKPDGDTIGASIGLASLLARMGKKAEIYSRDKVPYYLKYLKGSEKIKTTGKVKKEFDCAVILECSSLERMGSLIDKSQAKTFINIDHHRVFETFGCINYIDPKASSSSEQVFRLFKKLKMQIRSAEAEALYTGAVSDTGRFQYSNTTPFCHRMAAELIEAGVKPEKVFANLYEGNRLSSMRLLGLALETLKVTPDGNIAYMEISNKLFRKAGADYSETENIVNYGISIEGVKVAALLRETEEKNIIKSSLRSRGEIDVSKITKKYGGGGHRNAAGCAFKGSLSESRKKLVSSIRGFLK